MPATQNTAVNAPGSAQTQVINPETLGDPSANTPDLGDAGGTPQYESEPSYTNDGTTGGASSGFPSNIITGLESFLPSGTSLGQLALFGGLYGLEASQASAAQSQNATLAGEIAQIGQPAVTAGNQTLGAYESGKLTTPFQQQLQAALFANQQFATSSEQQAGAAVAGATGGQNLSGAVVSQTQQIEAQQAQLNTQATYQAFANELSSATGLISTGGQFVQNAVTTEIQSNTQLQQTLSSLMGSLASAYAQSIKPSGTTTPGTTVPGTSIPTGQINQAIQQANQQGTQSLETPSYTLEEPSYDLGEADTAGFQSGSAAAAGATGAEAVTGGLLPEATVTGSEILPAIEGGQLATVGAGAGDVAAGYAASGVPNAVAAAGGAGTSALGEVLPGVGAALGTYNTVNAIEQGNQPAAAISGAATGAEIGSFIGPEGTLIGAGLGAIVGEAGALIKGPHTAEGIANVGPGQQVIKLQSGNSALQQGGVAFGAGSSRGQGSAQWFLVPQTSGSLDFQNGAQNFNASGFPDVSKNEPFWIGGEGSQILTNFANSVPTSGGQPDFSSYIAQYQANPNATTGLVGVFNNNGGEQAWGTDFSTWLNDIWSVKHNVGGNLSTGG